MGLRRLHLVSDNVDLSSIQTLLYIDRQALNRLKLCLSVPEIRKIDAFSVPSGAKSLKTLPVGVRNKEN